LLGACLLVPRAATAIGGWPQIETDGPAENVSGGARHGLGAPCGASAAALRCRLNHQICRDKCRYRAHPLLRKAGNDQKEGGARSATTAEGVHRNKAQYLAQPLRTPGPACRARSEGDGRSELVGGGVAKFRCAPGDLRRVVAKAKEGGKKKPQAMKLLLGNNSSVAAPRPGGECDGTARGRLVSGSSAEFPPLNPSGGTDPAKQRWHTQSRIAVSARITHRHRTVGGLLGCGVMALYNLRWMNG